MLCKQVSWRGASALTQRLCSWCSGTDASLWRFEGSSSYRPLVPLQLSTLLLLLLHAGRAMNARDMQRVLHHLRRDPVVKAVYDAKSEEIGPNIYRFKAEIGAPTY